VAQLKVPYFFCTSGTSDRYNIFTVYYSHNEDIIIIDCNGRFQEPTDAWYTDSKIKRLNISFY
jgi:hypothetical protein